MVNTITSDTGAIDTALTEWSATARTLAVQKMELALDEGRKPLELLNILQEIRKAQKELPN